MVPLESDAVQTPVHAAALDRLLRSCPGVPDAKRTLVVSRFIVGADIGYRGSCRGRATTNNKSAELGQAGVTEAISAEVAAGTTRGPFNHPPFRNFVVNPLSARDRSDGGVRLILDLSTPEETALMTVSAWKISELHTLPLTRPLGSFLNWVAAAPYYSRWIFAQHLN